MAFCTGCGAQVGDWDRFCGSCGQPVTTPTERARRAALPMPEERSVLVPRAPTGDVILPPSSLPTESYRPPFETAWPELAATAAERGQQRALVSEIRSRAQWTRVALVFTSLSILLFAGALAYEASWLSDVQEWEQRSRPGGGLIAYDGARMQSVPRDLIEREETVYALMAGTTGWLTTLLFVTTVLLLRWVHGAWRDALNRGVRVPAWTPGWAVGWWFVPFVNLWMPFRVMSGLWRAAHLGIDGAPFEAPGLPFAMWGWWLLTAPATLVAAVFWGLRRQLQSDETVAAFGPPSIDFLILVDQLTIVAALAWFVGGVFLWFTVRRVMSSPRWDPDRAPL